MHVDDDLIAASPWPEENILPKQRKRFIYGKRHIDKLTHCGHEIWRDGKAIIVGHAGSAVGHQEGPDHQEPRGYEDRQCLRVGKAV